MRRPPVLSWAVLFTWSVLLGVTACRDRDPIVLTNLAEAAAEDLPASVDWTLDYLRATEHLRCDRFHLSLSRQRGFWSVVFYCRGAPLDSEVFLVVYDNAEIINLSRGEQLRAGTEL